MDAVLRRLGGSEFTGCWLLIDNLGSRCRYCVLEVPAGYSKVFDNGRRVFHVAELVIDVKQVPANVIGWQ